MGDLAEKPQNHAVGDIGGRKLALQQEDCLVWMHGDHAHMGRTSSLPGEADTGVGVPLVSRITLDHDRRLQETK